MLPIGILYEHPEWFRPLFAELERQGLPYRRIEADRLRFDPDEEHPSYSLVVNRMSPSAYLRGHAHAIHSSRVLLEHLEDRGVPLVNGPRAYGLELSKARQLTLMSRLGVPHPRSRVVNAGAEIVPAALELAFPLIVKPNVGGSGALMQRFDNLDELRAAAEAGSLEGVFGVDGTAIVQEFHPSEGGFITRVEFLDGKPLYAIDIHNSAADSFNLCPADICQVPAADDLDFCPVDAPTKKALRIEASQPSDQVVEWVLAVAAVGGLDVGGIEYLVSARDGLPYLYDVNALSNFVTDAETLVGFDPFERFVSYLSRRGGQAADLRAA
jgi:hypothetical protein